MPAREELMDIVAGGDELLDYLRDIYVAYEMTSRLGNAGKKEVWHMGTDGKDNYLGFHDGRNV